MNVALWLAQIALAIVFLVTGGLKLFVPMDVLAANMAWVQDTPAWLVFFIGLAEVAGGLGVILPALTRIQPALVTWASAGLTVLMILAAGLHIYRGELGMVPVPLALGTLAAFVTWGRSYFAPIAPRTDLEVPILTRTPKKADTQEGIEDKSRRAA